MFAVKSLEMKQLDRFMMDTVGLNGLVLMENASKSVVDVIRKQYPLDAGKEGSIVVLCGTGNNGGDGLCIARWLVHIGYRVQVLLLGPEEKFSQDAKEEYKVLDFLNRESRKLEIDFILEGTYDDPRGSNESNWTFVKRTINKAGLIVDGLIGTGCSRTLSDHYLKLVHLVNQSPGPVVSVDIPTGINSDNGKVMGDAIRAHTTVTFCLPKLGLVLYPGFSYVGQLVVADIGIYEEALLTLENPIELLDESYFMARLQKGILNRPGFSHKGTFGTVGVIAGDRHMIGATLLCAKAAYRTGAGLVKIFAPEELSSIIISSLPECVVVPYEKDMSKEAFDKDLEHFVLAADSIVLGPGLSKSLKARHMVQKVLQLDVKVVLDADALNIISEHLEWFEDRVCDCVITPHIGEMARLTGYPNTGISENSMQFAEAFADKYKVNTVLKSARTVVVTRKMNRYINMTGNSGMATAGSGDVLAGVIGGLLASKMTSEISSVMGVLLHSLSGDAYRLEKGEHSLMASDLISNLWRGVKNDHQLL